MPISLNWPSLRKCLVFGMPPRSKKPRSSGPNREAIPVPDRPRIFRYIALLRIRVVEGRREKEFFARDEDVDAAAKVGAEFIPLCNFVGDLRTAPPLTMPVKKLSHARLKWEVRNLHGEGPASPGASPLWQF